tara:strand:+ start:481 stop:702 length:222 start_codon:yes stop_codon:yes gene_type:complete
MDIDIIIMPLCCIGNIISSPLQIKVHRKRRAYATLYTMIWNFKDSSTDAEVLEWWRWAVDEGIPLLEEFSGTN